MFKIRGICEGICGKIKILRGSARDLHVFSRDLRGICMFFRGICEGSAVETFFWGSVRGSASRKNRGDLWGSASLIFAGSVRDL